MTKNKYGQEVTDPDLAALIDRIAQNKRSRRGRKPAAMPPPLPATDENILAWLEATPAPPKPQRRTKDLAGFRFGFSGRFSNHNRAEIEDLAWHYGAEIPARSSAQRCDHFVVGEGAGKRVQAAADRGATILTEDQFFQLLSKVETL